MEPPTTPFHNAYFERLDRFPVVVCRQCRYAVWPDQIEGHLRRAHRHVAHRMARRLGDEVRSWPEIMIYPSQLEVPASIPEPIQQLMIHQQGWQCQLQPPHCQYVCREFASMDQHWREQHQWSRARHSGRPSRKERLEIQRRQERACRPVRCQRLFPQGEGSGYFAIIGEDEEHPVPDMDRCQRFCEKVHAHWKKTEEDANRLIQDGEKDEANPWLKRTGWVPYLKKLDPDRLLESIEPPNSDPQKDEEPVAEAIWTAMAEMARISQMSVIHETGVFVRLEAIRSEKHQTQFRPLEPYMDEESIVHRVRPWQQMLMFFWRTQQPHEWRSPRYRFTRRQREAWERLVEAVVSGVEVDTDADADMETNTDADMGTNIDTDADTDTDTDTDAETGDEDETIPVPPLSPIQKRCLDFCIELLNQRVVQREYDSAMVCAMAVLGLRERGWRTPEDYPPMLSSIVKVARFMIIQKAIELAGPMRERAELASAMEDADWDGDSAYGGSPPPSAPAPPAKGCLYWVGRMTDQFMVRGSQGPMQWLLDLRTYGMKIHYNTTQPGHITWHGLDELLYQDMQFTMRQFRGMVHRVVHEARRILTEELLCCVETTVPAIPWATMRDNPTNESSRWNFLQDARTRWPVNGQRWMLDRIQQEPTLRRRFMQEDGDGFRRPRVDAYLSRVVEFQEKLLASIQFTWGQPARAPELLSIRHENSMIGGARNMFIEDGMVVLVARYHKGYQMTGDVKIIHRYLPREVGELLVWYLWLVQPFQRELDAYIYRRSDIPAHIWTRDHRGRKWTPERLRHIMQRESAIALNGHELTIAAYREIAIGISRRYMRPTSGFVRDEDEAAAQEAMEDADEAQALAMIADEQAGHTPHVAGMVYAREITERSGAVADRRQQFRTSSVEWHRFLGFASAMDPKQDETTSRKRKRAPFEEEAESGRMERWMRLRRMNAEAELKRMMDPDTTFRGQQKEVVMAIAQGASPIVSVMPTGAGKSLLFMLPAYVEPRGTTIVVVPLISLRGDIQRRCQALGISCIEWESRRPADGASIVLVTPESAVSQTFMTFINRKRWSHELDRIVIDECHIVLNDRYNFRKEMGQLGELVKGKTQMVLLTATLPRDEEAELCRRMYFEPSQVRWFRSRTARTNVAYRVVQMEGASRGARQHPRRGTQERVVAWIQRQIPRIGSGKMVIYASSVPLVKRLAQELGCDAYHSKAIDKAGMLEAFRHGVQPVIVATSALGMGIDIPDIRCVIHVGRTRTLLDYAQESGRAGRDGQRSEAIMILDGSAQHWGDPPDEDSSEKARGLVQEYIDGPSEGVRCRRAVLDRYLDGEIDGYQRGQCEEREEACDWCCPCDSSDSSEGEVEEGEEVPGGADPDSDGPEPIAHAPDEIIRTPEIEPVRIPAIPPNPALEEAYRSQATREFQQQRRDQSAPSDRLGRQREDEQWELESIRQQLAEWVGRCRVCAMIGLPDVEHSMMRCPQEASQRARIWAGEIMEQVKTWRRENGRPGYENYAACFGCHAPQCICDRWAGDGNGGYRRTARACQYDRVVISILAQLIHGPIGAAIRQAWQRRLAQWPDGAVDIDNRTQLVRHFQRRFGRRGAERSGLAMEMHWVSQWVAREMGER